MIRIAQETLFNCRARSKSRRIDWELFLTWPRSGTVDSIVLVFDTLIIVRSFVCLQLQQIYW